MCLAMVDLAVRPPRGIPQRGSPGVSLRFGVAARGCGTWKQPRADGVTRRAYR